MDDAPESGASSCKVPSADELLQSLMYAADDVFGTMVSDVAVLVAKHPASGDSSGVDRDVGHSVDIEAVVEFKGSHSGAIVLRCSTAGAVDITRGMLRLGLEETLSLQDEDIEDALGECANLVSGSMKARAFDTLGECTLATPRISVYEAGDPKNHCGTLVYWLSAGSVSMEIWMDSTKE